MFRIGIAAIGSELGTSGGVDVYTRSLVEALANYGTAQEYFVLVNQTALRHWQYRSWPPHVRFIGLHDMALREPLHLRALRRVRRLLGKPLPQQYEERYLAHCIDVLGLDLIHFPRTLIHPLSLHTPCVLTFFDMQHEYYPQFFTEDELIFRAKTYRPSVDKASHLIVPSEYTRCTLLEKYQVPSDKISSIPVGISGDFRRSDESDIRRVRAKYRLPSEFIFYPANPWQHKNHARLMAALHIYSDRHGECPWLVLTGRLQGERREASSLAVAAGVEDRVIDLAFVEPADLPALYSAATLMAFPSLFEGFGIPLVEAMACGCPIIAANATAIPEITNGAALLFDPCDAGMIAESIHRVLVDAELKQRLIAQGYAQSSRFAWDKLAAQLEGTYVRTAGRCRRS